jgi:hypothetical protein
LLRSATPRHRALTSGEILIWAGNLTPVCPQFRTSGFTNRYNRFILIVRECGWDEKKIPGKFFVSSSITPPDSGFSLKDTLMQIHRFDHAGNAGATRSVRLANTSAKDGISGSVSRENDAEGVVGESELASLSRQLGGISEVRDDVVEAAKVRVQRGDYLTRAAAEKLSDALLNRDV